MSENVKTSNFMMNDSSQTIPAYGFPVFCASKIRSYETAFEPMETYKTPGAVVRIENYPFSAVCVAQIKHNRPVRNAFFHAYFHRFQHSS